MRVTSLFLISTFLFSPAWATESEPDSCVYARSVKQFEILNEDMILLYGTADKIWLNRLAKSCRGLRKNMVVELKRSGSQICANDRFSAAHRGDYAMDGGWRQCHLGPFERLAPEQLKTLLHTIETS